MSKDKEPEELFADKEQATKDVVNQNFIQTVHKSTFVVRFKGKTFTVESPLVSLAEINEFLDFFKGESLKAIAAEEKRLDPLDIENLSDEIEDILE